MSSRLEPFPFDFLNRSPEGPLSQLVESVWFARGTVPYDRERIAPTGSTVAVIVLGDAIIETPDDGHGTPVRTDRGFIIGPHDRPVINEPTGETHAFGIITTPVGCETVFGVPPSRLRGGVAELDTVWPPAAELRSRLVGLEPAQALDQIEKQVAAGLGTRPAGLERIEQAVALLEADPTRSIADVANEIGITHGYLDRQFGSIVGLSPRRFARLIRMRRLLEALDVWAENPWTAIAADLGWFDQSHFIRDFKRHTGTTPNRYIAAQRSVSGVDAEAPGFVPEID